MVATPTHAEPTFHPHADPALLSEWGMLDADGATLTLAEGVVPYDLNTPLFSDYAAKLRTVWLPDGAAAVYAGDAVFDFPVGTVITKTFYYPRAGEASGVALTQGAPADVTALDLTEMRLIETRVLVRREAGWAALPYVWNDGQTEARLRRIGDLVSLELVDSTGGRQPFAYVVPDQNQCAGCHATNSETRALSPIGPRPRHVNRGYDYGEGPENQIAYLQRIGYLAGAPASDEIARNADWRDEDAGLPARARAYLDINCAHCHSAVGPADTSGLHLEATAAMGPNFGLCKAPVAAGPGTGGRTFAITPGAPEESILLYRMETTDPAAMMPELGRSTVHDEGVALIRAWIAEMEGECGE